MASRPGLLLVLLVLLLAATAAAASIGKRGATLSYPAAGSTAFLSPPLPTGSNKDASQPAQQQHRTTIPSAAAAAAAAKPLPFSRRGRSRGSSGRRHALPPFDTPLDPATIEAMVQQAGAAGAPVSQQLGGGGGGIGEVTPEQLWVGFIAGVFPFVWAGYEFWKRIDTQQRELVGWACFGWQINRLIGRLISECARAASVGWVCCLDRPDSNYPTH